jgi:hypothetical protein
MLEGIVDLGLWAISGVAALMQLGVQVRVPALDVPAPLSAVDIDKFIINKS